MSKQMFDCTPEYKTVAPESLWVDTVLPTLPSGSFIVKFIAGIPAPTLASGHTLLVPIQSPPSKIPSKRRTPWQIASELYKQVPESAWADVPTDLSANIDHYLYGAPKDTDS